MESFTESSFESEVLQSNIPVLVDFWAEWCGPCRMVGPILEQLAGEYSGKIKIGKVNVDEERQIASRYGIRSIPTFIIFKGGENVKQLVGALPADKIRQEIDAVI